MESSLTVQIAEMPKETTKLIQELKAWCDGAYGRRAEIGRMLGKNRQTIQNWFAGKQQPTGEQALVVLKFLEEQKKLKKKSKL